MLGFALDLDRGTLAAFGFGVAQVAVAPFTTSHGDGDGLWVLIVPFTIIATVVYGGVAAGSALLRSLLARRLRSAPPRA